MWAVETIPPELSQVLLLLSSAPCDIPVDAMCISERFVIWLHDGTSKGTYIYKARRKLLAMRNNEQLTLPAKAALEEHIRRAVYHRVDLSGVRYC